MPEICAADSMCLSIGLSLKADCGRPTTAGRGIRQRSAGPRGCGVRRTPGVRSTPAEARQSRDKVKVKPTRHEVVWRLVFISFHAITFRSRVARSQPAKPARKQNLTPNSPSRSFEVVYLGVTGKATGD